MRSDNLLKRLEEIWMVRKWWTNGRGFKQSRNKNEIYSYIIKETVDITISDNEERILGKTKTHGWKWRRAVAESAGISRTTYNSKRKLKIKSENWRSTLFHTKD